MKVTTKGRYGLRILLDVALHQGAGAVALSEISKRQTISRQYLWQVINPLKTAGLLHATRGAHGGYVLARPPDAISLWDVVTILEGPVSVTDCADAAETCPRSSACLARSAWIEVDAKLAQALKGITLQRLLQSHRNQQGGSIAYSI